MTGGNVRIKPVFWMGSSRTDLKSFPQHVQSDVGYALFAAQRGEEYPLGESAAGLRRPTGARDRGAA